MNYEKLSQRIKGVYSYNGKEERVSQINGLIWYIMKSQDVTEDERMKLLEQVAQTYGGRQYLLTRSLYNLILMEKRGTIEIPARAKLSSYANLIRNGLVYTDHRKVEIRQDLLNFDINVAFLVLTPLGMKVAKERLLVQGKIHVQKELNILNKMGY